MACLGGAGNDVYFVDNAGDAVSRMPAKAPTLSSRRPTSRCRRTWKPWCCKAGDLQGYGNSQANTLYGNTGGNLLNGEGGADVMLGGLGNDVYFVDNSGDLVFENLNEGTDAVFASVNYTLTANVETLVLQGAGNLTGTGNDLANKLFGNCRR